MRWPWQLLRTSEADRRYHEAPARVASSVGRNLAEHPEEPFEQVVRHYTEGVSNLARRGCSERGWGTKEVDRFLSRIARALLAEAKVPRDKAQIIADAMRERTRVDVAAGKPPIRTPLADHMGRRDKSRWNFSAYGTRQSADEADVFAQLEVSLSVAAFLYRGALGLERDERSRIAALARTLTIECACDPHGADLLHQIDSAMRERGDADSVGAGMVKPLLAASKRAQPAPSSPSDPAARASLLLGGKAALTVKARLDPADLVALMQSWFDRFLVENGQEALPGEIVHVEAFRQKCATARLSDGEFATLQRKLLST